MLPPNHPDRIQITFDDHRLVANAGLILPATLARRLGLPQLVQKRLDLGDAPGRANTGDQMMTLVASALAGGDCIDDADVLRTGGTARALGGTVKAPSTLGTLHLGRLPAQLPVGPCLPTGPGEPRVAVPGLGGWCGTRPRAVDHRPGLHHLRDLWAGQGGGASSRLHRRPGLSPAAGRRRRRRADGPAQGGPRQHRPRRRPLPAGDGGTGALRRGQGATLTVRADSGFYTHALVALCRQLDGRFSITIRQRARLRNLIGAIPEDAWTPIPYWMDGAADVAETTCTPFQSEPDAVPVRLIVRRVKPTPGSQLALFATYSYHGFITDRDGETRELEADHRRHAEIENAIRDLKHGVGLNHLPSGRCAANAAWLAVQVMAHNLARWTARRGLGEQIVTTKTLRRRFFALAGRLTRSARRLTLHLPRRWPWEEQFSRALARLQAIPLPA